MRSRARHRRAGHAGGRWILGLKDLEGALANGGVAPLPEDPARFNLIPRPDGPHPIVEKDLSNQASYLAARPATLGVLLDLASRVHTGPVEITSLVRHGEYQEALRVTNTNASTSVPMHTMGLAFDIALINTPLRTADEIRKVLRAMRRRRPGLPATTACSTNGKRRSIPSSRFPSTRTRSPRMPA